MTDTEYLKLAISIGYLNIDKFRNKHVGCVIVKDDRIISVGFRTMIPSYMGYKYACYHSEALALKAIESLDVTNATIFCTTEPCSYRIVDDPRLYPSLPCVDYIIQSRKINRVVYAKSESWVGDGGARLLNAAGISTEIIPLEVPFVQDVIPEEFKELIEPFLEKK